MAPRLTLYPDLQTFGHTSGRTEYEINGRLRGIRQETEGERSSVLSCIRRWGGFFHYGKKLGLWTGDQ